jgi:hypothetical protein
MTTASIFPKDIAPPMASTGIGNFLTNEPGCRLHLCGSTEIVQKPHALHRALHKAAHSAGGSLYQSSTVCACKLVPESVKVDAFAPCHEPLHIRAAKIEMP